MLLLLLLLLLSHLAAGTVQWSQRDGHSSNCDPSTDSTQSNRSLWEEGRKHTGAHREMWDDHNVHIWTNLPFTQHCRSTKQRSMNSYLISYCVIETCYCHTRQQQTGGPLNSAAFLAVLGIDVFTAAQQTCHQSVRSESFLCFVSVDSFSSDIPSKVHWQEGAVSDPLCSPRHTGWALHILLPQNMSSEPFEMNRRQTRPHHGVRPSSRPCTAPPKKKGRWNMTTWLLFFII